MQEYLIMKEANIEKIVDKHFQELAIYAEEAAKHIRENEQRALREYARQRVRPLQTIIIYKFK